MVKITEDIIKIKTIEDNMHNTPALESLLSLEDKNTKLEADIKN